jgi:formamidopyrimidine-DNA glycosylase
MSGRVLVDGEAAGDPLVYASNREASEWHRFTLRFDDGGRVALRDPRRLGAVELDPDEDRLGVDAMELTLAQLRALVARSRAPVKALLMNQAKVAGLGNLLVDEALWRAGVDPTRQASSLDAAEQVRLHRAIRTTLRTLGRRGGSHTGDLMIARRRHPPPPDCRRPDHVLVSPPSAVMRGARRCRSGRARSGWAHRALSSAAAGAATSERKVRFRPASFAA